MTSNDKFYIITEENLDLGENCELPVPPVISLPIKKMGGWPSPVSL